MSLFHLNEWYTTDVEEGRFITNACLIGNRDQVIVGALTGVVVIVDPGKDVENRNETSILIEKTLPHPVLQIAVGRFLASYDENLLAILHPKHLAFYRLNSADEESFTLDRIFEHRLKAGPAYNMRVLFILSISTWEWSFNLGDTPIDIADLNIVPIQPSILVLCKRALFCMTHGGTPRFIIRLQAVATSLLVYKTTADPKTQLCIGTATKTLLFFRDVTMIWAAQMDFVPLKGMVTALSDDCRLVIGYLGTEPSLFRMPITETRYIDFEKRRAELDEFEEVIRTFSKDSAAAVGSMAGLELKTTVEMDRASRAYDTQEGVPSATLNVSIKSGAKSVDLALQAEIFAHSEYFTLTPAEYSNVPITLFVKESPLRDARYCLAATTNSGDGVLVEGHLPLKLLCHETNTQRNSQVKLSIDSTGGGVEIADLYPEFQCESQSSLGLQPFGSEVVVSVFSAAKNARYRVQSDSVEFFFLVLDDLVRRLRKKHADAKLSCPVPLHLFATAIADQVDLEKRKTAESKEVERVSVQMRHVETILLNKLKAEREESMTPVNVLINYSYRELLTLMDRLKATEDHLRRHERETLRPLLNLMHLVMEINEIAVPFDGRILDASPQSLADRLPPLLGSAGAGAAEVDAAELTRLLVAFCEQGGRLGGILEMAEEEEENENEKERHDLVQLESGAMALNTGFESFLGGSTILPK
ncbi:Protein PTHB1 [Aphelenchoides fujianensis]|nr:Protein PTHB1 [Aphelenchoides fujianensis]